jgi:hypothetical protein
MSELAAPDSRHSSRPSSPIRSINTNGYVPLLGLNAASRRAALAHRR